MHVLAAEERIGDEEICIAVFEVVVVENGILFVKKTLRSARAPRADGASRGAPGPRREGPSALPVREAVPAALAVREMGAEAVAERAAAIRAADVTLGLEVAVRAPADSIDGRLAGTGRRPALAAEGVCGLAAAEEVDAAGVLAVAVVRVSPAAVLAAGVAADEAPMEGLTVRAAARLVYLGARATCERALGCRTYGSR